MTQPKVRAAGAAHASYLVGGATFPAFLALFAQSIVQNEDSLPIRYFVVGRIYSKRLDGPGTLQSSAVQAFVACRNKEEQEAEYANLTNLMEKFYAENIGLSFQTKRLAAPQLRTYESKKLSFVTKDRNKEVGDLAVIDEYVSKRLLCCYIDSNRSPKFMSLITGQFMNITDFLRPIEENNDTRGKLTKEKTENFALHGNGDGPSTPAPSTTSTGSDDLYPNQK